MLHSVPYLSRRQLILFYDLEGCLPLQGKQAVRMDGIIVMIRIKLKLIACYTLLVCMYSAKATRNTPARLRGADFSK